jgi:sec-independent protein translocase protein TatA
MFGLGVQELLIVLLILVVLFGGSRLAKLGKGLGEAIGGFRREFSRQETDRGDI